MADARLSQARVRAFSDSAAGNARATQTRVRALVNFPSEEGRVTQARVRAMLDDAAHYARLTQARVRVLYRGRVEDPKVRAWTFTMDGHDYYVLRLGQQETLVFDLRAQQWYTWASGESQLWRAFTGINWLGAEVWSANYGSNIIVGDDGNGSLYFLDPLGDTDDDALVGSETPRTFERMATGQVALRGFNAVPCYGVQLLGSVGETSNEDLTAIELLTSDDMGNTYDSQGTVTVESGDYNARVEWLSLGSMTGPGRLFRIVDTGAIKRIDSLEMIDG